MTKKETLKTYFTKKMYKNIQEIQRLLKEVDPMKFSFGSMRVTGNQVEMVNLLDELVGSEISALVPPAQKAIQSLLIDFYSILVLGTLEQRIVSSDFEWSDKYEVFNFMGMGFNVKRAKDIIRKKPRPVIQQDIQELFSYVNLDPTKTMMTIYVDIEKIKEGKGIDLTIPVIFSEVHKGKHHFNMLIDGWHRVARAKYLGITMLPAVFLDKKESKLIFQE